MKTLKQTFITLLIIAFAISFNNNCNAQVIFTDTTNASMTFGAAEIGKAFTVTTTVKTLSDVAASTETTQIIIVLKNDVTLKNLLTAECADVPTTIDVEGYSIRITKAGAVTRYWSIGSDAVGAMYGALDIAEAITLGSITNLVKGDNKPYIAERGIKFNIPLDARTPSYSDAADNAWNNVENMWDFQFWTDYLDNLARYRYNVLSLWNEHPFPSLVKVPEYPLIALNDVKKVTIDFNCVMDGTNMLPANVFNSLVTIKTMTIDEKIVYWNKVMQYAKDRGIDCYIITWNIFVYGTNGQYGITDLITNTNTIDYFRKSVKQLILTYPLLAGIGITAGENMGTGSTDAANEDWLWKTYGLGWQDAKAVDPSRKIKLIHRTWQNGISTIAPSFTGWTDPMDYEYKYSIAHMFASTKPDFANSTIADLPAGRKLWLTIRNDDFFMMRWGDAEFARTYIKNMPSATVLAGFMMGSSGYIWGREMMSTEPETPRQQTLDKHWYYFLLFGRLAYNPNIPAQTFKDIMAKKLDIPIVQNLYDGWASVSKVLPLVTSFHWQGADFQWYPEACYSTPGRTDSYGYHTINHFITVSPQSGVPFMSIPNYVAKVTANGTATGTTPVQNAATLKSYSDEGLRLIKDIYPEDNKELRLTLGDIKAMAYLGYYYSEKIAGATNLALFNKTTTVAYKDSAIKNMTRAAVAWRKYACQISAQYNPWKSARIGMINVKTFWDNALNDIVLAGGTATIPSAIPIANGTILEAEAAQYSAGSIISTNVGFTGTGAVKLSSSAGGLLTWAYNATKAGWYVLEFRYAMASGNVAASLTTNQKTDNTLSFWKTIAATNWQVETRTVYLNAGSNNIILTIAGNAPAIDHLNIVDLVYYTNY
jgi:hypothetical protein